MYSPMLYSTALPFIHSIYKSLHLLTPTSHSILAPTPFPSETTSPPKCALTGEWMEKKNKLWYVHIMGYWKWKVKSLSRVWLFVTPWTVAYQVPPSTGFSRKEYWSGLPFPSPNRILGSNKKKNKILIHATTLMNLRGSIEWKKPDTEQYIPFGSIYTNFQAELTRDDRGQNSFTSNEALSKEEHKGPSWKLGTFYIPIWILATHCILCKFSPSVMFQSLCLIGWKILEKVVMMVVQHHDGNLMAVTSTI